MTTRELFVVEQAPAAMSRIKGVHYLSKPSRIHSALRESRTAGEWKKATWLALNTNAAEMLLDEVKESKPRSLGILALLENVTPSRLAIATEYFRIVWQSGLHWLPSKQVIKVLNLPDCNDRIVAGMVDQVAGNLLVYRGDFAPIVVPLVSLKSRGKTVPDFNDFEIIDWGHTLRFGAYEAAADAILYENDADFRRRKKQALKAHEKSFGASLRRLRLQRELRQADFGPDISAKTIARLENGEVEKPHGQTLNRISQVLNVDPSDIESY